MAQNEFNIFDLNVKDLDTGEDNKGGSDLYTPKPDQGVDGVYKSLIRFLPNPKNPRKPFIRKFVYWLEDSDGNGSYYDSPSTVGDKCPVQDMFFKLRNSDSAVDKKASESLKRKEVYYALVQIIKDPQKPDLEGQIKIYKFGYKIKTKIDEELNPPFGEPVQIFDPFEGKNFELIISKKAGYPNYDSCKFQGSTSAMMLDGKVVDDSPESRKAIMEYLNEAPELSSFDYKPWTNEQHSKVMNILSQYTSPGASIEKVTSPKQESVQATPKQETPLMNDTTNEASNVESDEGGLDDFINGLDL